MFDPNDATRGEADAALQRECATTARLLELEAESKARKAELLRLQGEVQALRQKHAAALMDFQRQMEKRATEHVRDWTTITQLRDVLNRAALGACPCIDAFLTLATGLSECGLISADAKYLEALRGLRDELLKYSEM